MLCKCCCRKNPQLKGHGAAALAVPAEAAVPERQRPGARVRAQGRPGVSGEGGERDQGAQLHQLHPAGAGPAHAVRGRHERRDRERRDRAVAVLGAGQRLPPRRQDRAQAAHRVRGVRGGERAAARARRHGRRRGAQRQALGQSHAHPGRSEQPGRSGAHPLQHDPRQHGMYL